MLFVVITFVHFILLPITGVLLTHILGIIQNGKIWSIFIYEVMLYTYNSNVNYCKQVRINIYITNNRMHYIIQLHYLKTVLQTNNRYTFPVYFSNIITLLLKTHFVKGLLFKAVTSVSFKLSLQS